ncbi:MAG: cobaltochelatase subunit CobN [Methanomicrobiales archaeon]|nr:cobaltochelatase subunit CobN [Methanomicrobiales archaeon]
MRVAAAIWASELPLLVEAAAEAGVELHAASTSRLSGREEMNRFLEGAGGADVILLHPTQEPYWDEMVRALPCGKPVVSYGFDISHWALSNVPPGVSAMVNAYFAYGGKENMLLLLRYLGREVLGLPWEAQEPLAMPWEGIYHPDADRLFLAPEEYFAFRPRRHRAAIGILFYRIYWVNRDLRVVDALIREVERHADVIAVFSTGTGEKEGGRQGRGGTVRDFFTGKVDALIDLQSSLAGDDPASSVELLKELDVPVFHPVMLYYRTRDDWLARRDGMGSMEIAWSVVVPELQGMVEFIPCGTASVEQGRASPDWHDPLEERIGHLVERVLRWVRLRQKPTGEKRIAFILNNAPCASVEANVGSAAHLDALESVVEILKKLKKEGYDVEVPESGEALVQEIMSRRAISEFRWTSVEDIVRNNGYLALVGLEEYQRWFDALPSEYRERVIGTWGDPPGEAREGVPAAMLYEGRIVITGISLGNAVVCTQPKRGCAGARCDGMVCRILHDPEVPPPHHYLATYRYLQEVFGADAIVHVGTHGTLEFLPGKAIALSAACAPDAVLGTLPQLYIYNSDNPPEGTIAKRRAYAVLVDHLQTVMASGGLYGALKELEEQIAEYRRAGERHARAHALEHLILDRIRECSIAEEIRLDDRLGRGESMQVIIDQVHRVLSRMEGTSIPMGMHIFGRVPAGERRARFIEGVLRYEGKVRGLIAHLSDGDKDRRRGEAITSQEPDPLSCEWIGALLEGRDPAEAMECLLGIRLGEVDRGMCASVADEVREISALLDATDETGSLVHALHGGHVEPGPSGLITRGRKEILPTGRNFYSMDPSSIPTEAAWRIGRRLAEALLEKYREEHGGRYPENVGMLWMASDIMWADGEQLAQMLWLLGIEPVWSGGRVSALQAIPLPVLKRPRIDLTVRTSAILRDCFPACIELLDDALQLVAAREEPVEMNYVRKHAGEQGSGRLLRIFSSRPGTYGMGVNLAVYASAWRDAKDLADIFVEWNAYAYGRDRHGADAKEEFRSQLKTVSLTFNKTVTDEYDLLGCCCYFGSHGGMTAAARSLSGEHVEAYYGDTRERDGVEVRTLGEEIARVVRAKLLHPGYIDALKEHGYTGAAELSRRIGRVYGWEATTEEVGDHLFDEIARTFLLDGEMRRFFREHNPWALEEAGRRLLEAHARGLWNASEEVLEGLKEAYLEVEGWMEDERAGDAPVQGGAIDIITRSERNDLAGTEGRRER